MLWVGNGNKWVKICLCLRELTQAMICKNSRPIEETSLVPSRARGYNTQQKTFYVGKENIEASQVTNKFTMQKNKCIGLTIIAKRKMCSFNWVQEMSLNIHR